ncbi:hypothetical protein UlMin_029163 [Ulmus minor]
MGYGSLILLLTINLFVPFSSGESDGVCISQGGRFPTFSSEGKPPKKASRGSKDLTLCRIFRRKTCCDVAQTHPALLNIRKLTSTGEASQECLQLWELLECSICDPHVGVKPGPPLICASFCDRVFKSCSDAYFSMDTMTKVLSPCGVNDFVCGRASKWVQNGTELCQAAGFAIKDDVYDDTSCYGLTSLDSIANSWKASNPVVPQKGGILDILKDFEQWMRDMPFKERVSWAVGGLVLTAGLLFVSKRKSYSQRQKFAAIQRAAKKVEFKMSPKYAGTQASKKGSKR